MPQIETPGGGRFTRVAMRDADKPRLVAAARGVTEAEARQLIDDAADDRDRER